MKLPSGPNLAVFILAIAQLFLITASITATKKIKFTPREICVFALFIVITATAYLRLYFFDLAGYIELPIRIMFGGIPNYLLMLSTYATIRHLSLQTSSITRLINFIIIISIVWALEFLGYTYDLLPTHINSTPMDFLGFGFPDFFDSALSTNILHTSKVMTFALLSICLIWLKAARINLWLIIPFGCLIPAIIATQEKEVILMLGVPCLGIVVKLLADLLNGSFRNNPRRSYFSFIVAATLITVSFYISQNILEKRQVTQNYGAQINATLDSPTTFTILDTFMANAFLHSSYERIVQGLRSYEVFLDNVVGYGPGIGQIMLFSGKIPSDHTEALRNSRIFKYYASVNRSGSAIADFQQIPVTERHSLHLWFLNIFLDYGVYGILIFSYFLKIIVVRYFETLFHEPPAENFKVLALLALIGGLFFSPLQKAALGWLLILLFVFIKNKDRIEV